MNTSAKYPRHRFTAETFLRINSLYSAACQLERRAGRYRDERKFDRSYRASDAAFRLRSWAFELGVLALSIRELGRCCEIQQAETDATKAKQAAPAAQLHIQIENGVSTHAA